MNIKDLPEESLFTPGHTACAGCPAPAIVRNMMKIFGKDTIVYTPANCLLVFSGTYPYLAWRVPYLHEAFENTAACISGVARAYRKKGKKTLVVGIAGDGGTYDIGIQALSGAAERNEDVIYVCYDNEAYMNTGIQRSGATPYGAATTTTPAGRKIAGKLEHKKDMAEIMRAHEVPYVATLSISHPKDFLEKVEKAKETEGFRYLHVLSPCPTGWRFDPAKSIEIARKAVDSGMWTLYEAEYGEITNIYKPKKKIPVEEYIKGQGRFRHFTPEMIAELQKWVDRKWKRLYGELPES
ncbi:MAG: pyruvate synthase subunit beta [Thermoplasmata archaeon]|nr:MAG: pyruvate synthase subunit beta [Thermoplasmata archaeon]KAA0014792.1 MAG: pyruvate synthase subunit beta [Thermoplasmata archaeon]OYT61301.1 MAG: 2-ketoisovalerate ferredoxin oxidoreductase [Thermoplasmatales archaeon ex4484_30]